MDLTKPMYLEREDDHEVHYVCTIKLFLRVCIIVIISVQWCYFLLLYSWMYCGSAW